MVYSAEIHLERTRTGDVVDVTADTQEIVEVSGINDGTVTVFCPGSTGGVTTVEYEPGLVKDLPEMFERLIPSNRSYQHDETWHDGNGFSHLRAALVGPGLTVPVVNGRLTLGTWQQIVFLEFDNKSRSRRLVVQVVGDA